MHLERESRLVALLLDEHRELILNSYLYLVLLVIHVGYL